MSDAITADVEKILLDCRAAHAFLTRIESRIHRLAAFRGRGIDADASNSPSGASADPDPCADPSKPSEGQEGAESCVSCGFGVPVQFEMFPELTKSARSAHRKDGERRIFRPRKGCPTLKRGRVFANIAEIAAGRDLLSLSQVNRIFGYDGKTSGTFVKHAVKRGELLAIPCGREMRFLTSDVRAFAKSYFDSLDESETARNAKGRGK